MGVVEYASQTVSYSSILYQSLALSRWNGTPSRLVNSRCFSSIAIFYLSIWETYLSDFNVWFCRKSSLFAMLFQSQLILCITFSGYSPAFERIINGSLSFSPGHFSIQIVVNNLLFITCDRSFKKWIFFLFFSIESHLEMHSIYFLLLSLETREHSADSCIQGFLDVFYRSYEICGALMYACMHIHMRGWVRTFDVCMYIFTQPHH